MPCRALLPCLETSETLAAQSRAPHSCPWRPWWLRAGHPLLLPLASGPPVGVRRSHGASTASVLCACQRELRL